MPIPAVQTMHIMAVKAFALRGSIKKIHTGFKTVEIGGVDDFQLGTASRELLPK